MAKRTPKAPNSPTPVDAIKHKDTRKNIPTEEPRDFVADDEAKPKTLLYPRDPSLDPQLVWKGKDEQDLADLAVPVSPEMGKIAIKGINHYGDEVLTVFEI